MKDFTIIKKYTEEIEISEIDIDIVQDTTGVNDYDDYNYIVSGDEKQNWTGESTPVKIDKVISILSALKSGGANYVEIMYHEDHIGYVFNGVDVKLAGDDDVAENKKLIDAKKAEIKQREIEALERKLSQLKG